MRSWTALLLLSIAALAAAETADKPVVAYPVTYAGGSLPLDQSKARATLENEQVVFMQHSRRVAVPLKDITEISCGTEVHRRLGAFVLGVVPLMHWGETENHYIGVSWTNAGGPAREEVLLKVGRAEYRDFLAALEKKTGIKAVNTNQVPTVVHYNL